MLNLIPSSRCMGDEVIMVGEHGPCFKYDVVLFRQAQQMVFQQSQVLGAAEQIIARDRAGRDDVRPVRLHGRRHLETACGKLTPPLASGNPMVPLHPLGPATALAACRLAGSKLFIFSLIW